MAYLAETVDKRTRKEKVTCFHCGKEYVNTGYYNSNSVFYRSAGVIPYCKRCLDKIYQDHVKKYKREGYPDPEKRAVKRICMALDIYYREDVFNSAVKRIKEDEVNSDPFSQYMRVIQLMQYNRNRETYENTLVEEETRRIGESDVIIADDEDSDIDPDTVRFFGAGFRNEDYKFLKKEYDDWTARHECKTKSQEEIFKDICFNRLQNLKALQRGEDTKDITASFQKLLDSGKLQPKQNSGDTMADNQTFGTLIDKWENTRPLPEIDDELKDVDNIALYIDVFFKGHLAKMMGLKNGLSNLYTKFMKKFTVEKPEYNDDENSEILFDAIFGGDLSDDKGAV